MAEAFVSPEGRLLFPQGLWAASTPRDFPDSPAKYACTLVLLKSDPEVANLINQINATTTPVLKTAQQAPGVLAPMPSGSYCCLQDGAAKHPQDPFYADKWLLAVARREPMGAPKVLLGPSTPLIDKGDMYSGVKVRIQIDFYSYTKGSGGVTCTMHAVMKTGDAEQIGTSVPSADTAFAGFGTQAGTPAPAPAPAGFSAPGPLAAAPWG